MSYNARIYGNKSLPFRTNGTYSVGVGQFGVITKDKVMWFSCREQYHAFVDPLKKGEHFYAVSENKSHDVAEFIGRIEDHLGVEPKSNFQYSEMNTIMWVEASSWWMENPMKHSFFTICLRAANTMNWPNLDHSNWRDILLGCKYLSYLGSHAAAKKFLDGYTEYTGNIRWWVKQFSGKSDAEIDILLKKPPTEQEKQQIQKIAYNIWEEGGKKEGKHIEHWVKAKNKFYYDMANTGTTTHVEW